MTKRDSTNNRKIPKKGRVLTNQKSTTETHPAMLTPELKQYYKRLENWERQKMWRSNPDNHEKYLAYLKRWRSNHQDHIKEYRERYSARKKMMAIIESVDSGNKVLWGSRRWRGSASHQDGKSR